MNTDSLLFVRLCFFIFVVSFSSACSSAKQEYEEGTKVIGWLRGTTARIKTVRASISLLQESPHGLFRGDLYLFYRYPDRIRMDVIGPVGNTVGVIAGRKNSAVMIDYYNRQAFFSLDINCILSKFLRIKAVFDDMVPIFLGNPPIIKFDICELRESAGGYYVLELNDKDSGIVEKLQLVQGLYGTVTLRAIVFDESKKILDINFRQRGWNRKNFPTVPRVIEVGVVQEKIVAFFKYKKVDVEEKLEDSIFDVKVPSDFAVENLNCTIRRYKAKIK